MREIGASSPSGASALPAPTGRWPVRVLHITRSLNPSWGGVVEAVRNISAAAPAADDVSAEVLCLDNASSEWLTCWDVPVHAIGPANCGVYGYTRALLPWLVRNAPRFDLFVVHGIWMYLGLAVRQCAVRAGVPYVVLPHGSLDPWFRRRYPLKHVKKLIYWRLFESKVFRDSAGALFTTEEERTSAQHSFRPLGCTSAVIGLGIKGPVDLTEDQREDGRHLRSLDSRFDALPYLLFLGRIHEKKGIDLLVAAMSRLKHRHPRLFLVIAGPGDTGVISRLQHAAMALGVSQDILWTGPVYGPTKWALLRSSDAFILPSHQENFGVSVVEALACGKPVLISNKVNIWRVVADGHAGFVEPDDIGGTEGLMERWLALTRAEKNQMSRNARHCFEEQFTIESAQHSYRDYFSHVSQTTAKACAG